ncbi:MAG: FIG00440904: hypothetical protein [uncultured Gemmatimonadetes bacterium]|uniref:Uncharacterized protein n=1 Tax=uncultured Gemmatimonadota bacterium TaxID=203437 RepID=A0A6J4MC19_9BACT|nr:MAG: FIG00440904: hypothetical protein [uncultured Gemmatimonadota bacterium]
MTVLAPAPAPQRVATGMATGDRFYVRIAGACLVVAVIGFAPTYWLPLVRGTLDLAPIAHVHAAVFYGWTLLFLLQSWLVAQGRLTRHREWGVFGVALATTMCFVGMAAAMNSLGRATAAGLGDAARPFSIVPVSGIAFFALLFTAALLRVRQPQVHKRLMLVATVSLLQAAVGRWFLIFLAPAAAGGGPAGPPPVFVTVMPALVSDLLIVAAMVHDRRTTGRVHRVYWIAGGALLALQVLRVPLSTTAGWARIADWLLTMSL